MRATRARRIPGSHCDQSIQQVRDIGLILDKEPCPAVTVPFDAYSDPISGGLLEDSFIRQIVANEQHSLRRFVRRDEVIRVMERLETLGARAILETQINNCRL